MASLYHCGSPVGLSTGERASEPFARLIPRLVPPIGPKDKRVALLPCAKPRDFSGRARGSAGDLSRNSGIIAVSHGTAGWRRGTPAMTKFAELGHRLRSRWMGRVTSSSGSLLPSAIAGATPLDLRIV